MNKQVIIFKPGELEKIAKIIGDTQSGLTGTEIACFLSVAKIPDPAPGITKWRRLYNALETRHNQTHQGNHVLVFIAKALEPARFIGNEETYGYILSQLNRVLIFHGLEFRDDGRFHSIQRAESLSEVQQRVNLLKSGVTDRKLHPALLNYCREELLGENYFYAVFEAMKGIAEIIRNKSGIQKDGGELIDTVFSGDNPILKINSYNTDSEKSEQKGFVNILKGLFGTFRNPLAHETKKNWDMPIEDALDFFSNRILYSQKA